MKQILFALFACILIGCSSHNNRQQQNRDVSSSSEEVRSVSSMINYKDSNSSLDKNIYEALTTEEVKSIREDIPSFIVFYDKIRPGIFSQSYEVDKVRYKKVSYRSLYSMFKYWESSELKNMIDSQYLSYSEEMERYQAQIDSVSNYFQTFANKIKAKGVPEFDYTKIFKHPEICYFSTEGYVTYVTYALPIRDYEAFIESGINEIVIKVFLTDINNPKKCLWVSDGVVEGRGHVFSGTFTMKLYNGQTWSLRDPRKTYALGDGNFRTGWDLVYKEYDSRLKPYNNFLNSFDWYYEVISCNTSYQRYIKEHLPETVYRYWTSQEGTDKANYIYYRNKMIKEYCNSEFKPFPDYINDIIETRISEKFPDEYSLYQRLKRRNDFNSREFESFFNKYQIINNDWMPSNIELPIVRPDGPFVQSIEYDKRIFRINQ